MINKHSNVSPVAKLARQLYTEGDNKVKPTWDQLTLGGACQSYWVDRAEKLMTLQQLPASCI
jgi:hypothetical protein